jgi:putative membrane protein
MKKLILPIVAGMMLGSYACQNGGGKGSGTIDSASNATNTPTDSSNRGQAYDSSYAHSNMDSTGGKMNSQPLDNNSAQFMVKVANVGMTEVQMGQLAQTNASSQRVKDFGSMMVKDHTAAGNTLKDLASRKGVTLPTSLDEGSMKHKTDLSAKQGKTFDKDYIKMMIDGHKQTIKDFEDIEKNSKDGDVRSFATSTLPTLKMHLDSAEAINKSLK